jgi:hypothetical protein
MTILLTFRRGEVVDRTVVEASKGAREGEVGAHRQQLHQVARKTVSILYIRAVSIIGIPDTRRRQVIFFIVVALIVAEVIIVAAMEVAAIEVIVAAMEVIVSLFWL